MIISQEALANVINSDHNVILLDTDMNLPSEKKVESKNLCSTDIPEYEVNNASEDEWNELISNLGSVDWDDIIDINTNVDTIASIILDKIEKNVKNNLRKKDKF